MPLPINGRGIGGESSFSMWEYRTSSPDWYKQLKAFARENRKNATLAETLLWDSLREELDTKVLRQHIVGDYIVDFLLPYYKLVIEVDGGYHTERQQADDDLLRSEALNRMGFYVIRFTNEMVMMDMPHVINRIKEHIINY